MTIKASSDPAVEPGMAGGLRILARIIATAHRQRLRDSERARGQCAGSPNAHQHQEPGCKPSRAKTGRRRNQWK